MLAPPGIAPSQAEGRKAGRAAFSVKVTPLLLLLPGGQKRRREKRTGRLENR